MLTRSSQQHADGDRANLLLSLYRVNVCRVNNALDTDFSRVAHELTAVRSPAIRIGEVCVAIRPTVDRQNTSALAQLQVLGERRVRMPHATQLRRVRDQARAALKMSRAQGPPQPSDVLAAAAELDELASRLVTLGSKRDFPRSRPMAT